MLPLALQGAGTPLKAAVGAKNFLPQSVRKSAAIPGLAYICSKKRLREILIVALREKTLAHWPCARPAVVLMPSSR